MKFQFEKREAFDEDVPNETSVVSVIDEELFQANSGYAIGLAFLRGFPFWKFLYAEVHKQRHKAMSKKTEYAKAYTQRVSPPKELVMIIL